MKGGCSSISLVDLGSRVNQQKPEIEVQIKKGSSAQHIGRYLVKVRTSSSERKQFEITS